MTDDDLSDMARLLEDPEVMRYYPAPKDRAAAQRWIDWNKANYAAHGFGLWVISTPEGEFVGDCGLTVQHIEGKEEIEIGYHVTPHFQGNGLATEAALACRGLAEARGIRYVTAIINPENIPSRRVAKKVGLVFEKEIIDDAGLPQVIYSADLFTEV